MIRSGTTVHERLSDNGQTRIDDVRLVYIEDEIRILDEIYPKPKGKGIALPCVNHFWIRYAVLQSLVVHEVEHVFYCEGKSRSSMGSAKDRFEQIVDEFL